MKIALLSAHLDDAALSASVAISASEATVVTLFTRLPPADLPATSWDRLTGATDSRTRQLERHAEDAEAMRILGAGSVYLDEPELLFRAGAPDLAAAIEKMADCFAEADEVWLPAAVGGHPDHVFARDAGLRAAAKAGHAQVVLYADFPYVILYGWPAWVTGGERDPYLDVELWLDNQLREAGLDPAVLEPAVVPLDAGQRERKAAVIEAYRSQAGALRVTPRDLAVDPTLLGYELSWRTALPLSRPA